MDYARALFAGVLLSSLLAHASPTLAVNTVTPQIGTWAIDEEVDGKPGRGFQIDVQNNVLVLYFYGYESGGEATFWLAAGRIPDGSDELTAELGAYEGGMAFGDPFRNATYVGARGQVTIRFSSLTRGEICLPNESCKAISAFNFGFEASSSELLGLWYGNTFDSGTDEIEAFAVRFNQVTASTDPAVVDRAAGTASSSVEGTMVTSSITCDRLRTPDPWQYRCRIGQPGETSELSFSVSRNAIVGQYYDDSDKTVEGTLRGQRARTASGKLVLPD